MAQIRAFFSGPVGYSDHTESTAVPLAAVALGADVIEKHITIDRDVPNAQDWKVSCDPSNFAQFITDIRDIDEARGGTPKVVAGSEQSAILWARKSLTTRHGIAAGTIIQAGDLVAQRPGSALPPSNLSRAIGQRARNDIPAGTPLSLKMIE